MEKTNSTIQYFQTMIGAEAIQTPSAAGNWLAGKLIALSYGQMEVAYLVREEMLNPHQTLHGGIASLMFDDLFGATVFCLEPRSIFVTVALNVEFLSSARKGDMVHARSLVKRQGATVINIEGELYRGQRLIAKATSILVSTSGQRNATEQE